MGEWMRLPFRRIHDPLSGFGVLLVPWFGQDRWGKRYWLAWFEAHGVRRTDINGFHVYCEFGRR